MLIECKELTGFVKVARRKFQRSERKQRRVIGLFESH